MVSLTGVWHIFHGLFVFSKNIDMIFKQFQFWCYRQVLVSNIRLVFVSASAVTVACPLPLRLKLDVL